MLEIEKNSLDIVKKILKQAGVKFYAFGSRVKGQSSKFSDLDLIYKEKIEDTILNKVKHELSESDLPFKVDLINFHDCKRSFIELIEKDFEEI